MRAALDAVHGPESPPCFNAEFGEIEGNVRSADRLWTPQGARSVTALEGGSPPLSACGRWFPRLAHWRTSRAVFLPMVNPTARLAPAMTSTLAPLSTHFFIDPGLPSSATPPKSRQTDDLQCVTLGAHPDHGSRQAHRPPVQRLIARSRSSVAPRVWRARRVGPTRWSPTTSPKGDDGRAQARSTLVPAETWLQSSPTARRATSHVSRAERVTRSGPGALLREGSGAQRGATRESRPCPRSAAEREALMLANRSKQASSRSNSRAPASAAQVGVDRAELMRISTFTAAGSRRRMARLLDGLTASAQLRRVPSAAEFPRAHRKASVAAHAAGDLCAVAAGQVPSVP